MSRIRQLLALLLACAALLPPAARAAPQLLHSEPSQFGKILVFDETGERCMNFNSMVDFGRQTCMSLEQPGELVFSYPRMMIGSLYAKPAPRHILIVGLGGAPPHTPLALLMPDDLIPHM